MDKRELAGAAIACTGCGVLYALIVLFIKVGVLFGQAFIY